MPEWQHEYSLRLSMPCQVVWVGKELRDVREVWVTSDFGEAGEWSAKDESAVNCVMLACP